MDSGLCLPTFREGASREGMALWFDETDPATVAAVAERFAREVAPLV